MKLETLLPPDQVILDPTEREQYGMDRTHIADSVPRIVFLPKTTEEVSRILTYCNEHRIPVVPSGGRTGLAAAATTPEGEVVISMSRMNRILDVDTVGQTIEVESGAILETIQFAADDAGMYFPVDFAAKGSCQAGGFVSTNAGGVKVLRYGMTRHAVLGLEVVQADGTVLDLNRKLVKDNSGYDLKQLFIGAEGTLGVITKITFQCMARPTDLMVMMLGVSEFSSIPEIYQRCRRSGLELHAFEFLTDTGVSAVLSAMPQVKYPFEEEYPFTVLVEINSADNGRIESWIADLFENGFINDAVQAHNSATAVNFWTLREAVSDSLYLLGTVHANDISVPVNQLERFLSEFESLAEKNYGEFILGLFGHIGDGNFHIYVIDPSNRSYSVLAETFGELDEMMFHLIRKLGGSISAEHGIGLLKRDALHYRRSENEIELMRKLKQLFDPNRILNPGKIFK